MAIHLIHGCFRRHDRKKQLDRLYVAEDKFERFLSSRRFRYESWPRSGGEAPVLTVDDGTNAAARACLIARRLGHEVIIFVNGMQIANQRPYFFSILDHAIDCSHETDISFDGQIYDLACPSQRRSFRNAARNSMLHVRAGDAVSQAEHLAGKLGVGPRLRLPDEVFPMSVDTLRSLRDAGVQIENHGWSHRSISRLSAEAFDDEFHRCSEWLRAHLNDLSNLYAVPYGVPIPSPSHFKNNNFVCFLADNGIAEGKIRNSIWNRRDVTEEVNCY